MNQTVKNVLYVFGLPFIFLGGFILVLGILTVETFTTLRGLAK